MDGLASPSSRETVERDDLMIDQIVVQRCIQARPLEFQETAGSDGPDLSFERTTVGYLSHGISCHHVGYHQSIETNFLKHFQATN
jgi:hypothetical protein